MKPIHFATYEEALLDLTDLLDIIDQHYSESVIKLNPAFTKKLFQANTAPSSEAKETELKQEAESSVQSKEAAAYLKLLATHQEKLAGMIIHLYEEKFVLTESTTPILKRLITQFSEIAKSRAARILFTILPHSQAKREITHFLIQQNDFTDVNNDYYYFNPLYVAVYYNLDKELLELLISNGAKDNTKSCWDSVVLLAGRTRNIEAAAVLISKFPGCIAEFMADPKLEDDMWISEPYTFGKSRSKISNKAYNTVIHRTFINAMEKLEKEGHTFQYTKTDKTTYLALVRAELNDAESYERCQAIYLNYINSPCLNYRRHYLTGLYKNYTSSKKQYINLVQYRIAYLIACEWQQSPLATDYLSLLKDIFDKAHIKAGVDPSNTYAMEVITSTNFDTIELFDPMLGEHENPIRISKKEKLIKESKSDVLSVLPILRNSLRSIDKAHIQRFKDEIYFRGHSTEMPMRFIHFALCYSDVETCSKLLNYFSKLIQTIRNNVKQSVLDPVCFPFLVYSKEGKLLSANPPELVLIKLIKVMEILETNGMSFEYSKMETREVELFVKGRLSAAETVDECFAIHSNHSQLKCISEKQEIFNCTSIEVEVLLRIFDICKNSIKDPKQSREDNISAITKCLDHPISKRFEMSQFGQTLGGPSELRRLLKENYGIELPKPAVEPQTNVASEIKTAPNDAIPQANSSTAFENLSASNSNTPPSVMNRFYSYFTSGKASNPQRITQEASANNEVEMKEMKQGKVL